MVEFLRVFRRSASCRVLGPGNRVVIWVQGCGLGCPGCIVPEHWGDGGERLPISKVAEWVLTLDDVEGITLSGGEPMEQAEGLCQLVDIVRATRPLTLMVYTGHIYERLLDNGTPAQRGLLARTDLLVDGPYVERLHSDLRWRGSSNQRILALTGIYSHLVQELHETPSSDRSAGMEFFVDQHNGLVYNGVPPMPGFRRDFEEQMARRGLSMQKSETTTP